MKNSLYLAFSPLQPPDLISLVYIPKPPVSQYTRPTKNIYPGNSYGLAAKCKNLLFCRFQAIPFLFPSNLKYSFN